MPRCSKDGLNEPYYVTNVESGGKAILGMIQSIAWMHCKLTKIIKPYKQQVMVLGRWLVYQDPHGSIP